MSIEVNLTADERNMLINSLNTLCNGGHSVPEWEFPTLIGFERSEVQGLLDKLSGLSNT